MERCECLDNSWCHFCTMPLDEGTDFTDSEAWCDWVITYPTTGNKLHVIAHFFCADGQPNVERG